MEQRRRAMAQGVWSRELVGAGGHGSHRGRYGKLRVGVERRGPAGAKGGDAGNPGCHDCWPELELSHCLRRREQGRTPWREGGAELPTCCRVREGNREREGGG
jgi:hypothetical protein